MRSPSTQAEMRRLVDEAMSHTFRPEFLNRIDDIVVFHPLGMAQIEKIVDIQLADVRRRLAKERMTLTIEPRAKQLLAEDGLDPAPHSARGGRRDRVCHHRRPRARGRRGEDRRRRGWLVRRRVRNAALTMGAGCVLQPAPVFGWLDARPRV